MLPLRDHLGEFTSELKPGDNIVEFAAAGPKNYGYKTHKGKVECKVCGFTLNTGTGAIELRAAETKRPRRSHATQRRPKGNPSPQPAQDQT